MKLDRKHVDYETTSYMPVVALSGAGLTEPLNNDPFVTWADDTIGFVTCYDTTGLQEYVYVVVKTAYGVSYKQMSVL